MTETANVNQTEREERRTGRPFAEGAESYGRDVHKMLDYNREDPAFSGDIVRLYARCAFRLAGLAMARQVVIQCAWCEGASGKTADAVRRGFDVTHTICAACSERVEKEGA